MPVVLRTNPPADPASLARIGQSEPRLPRAYLHYLGKSNGAEGDLGVEPGWFVVWPAEDAVSFSNEYGVATYLPGYFAFGGNGGGELFVFDLNLAQDDPPVLMVPAVGLAAEEMRLVADSFTEFESHIGKEQRDAV